jgi:hypothetical protein
MYAQKRFGDFLALGQGKLDKKKLYFSGSKPSLNARYIIDLSLFFKFSFSHKF